MQESKAKTLTAAVVSKSGDKSITVAIDYKVKHPKYGKYMRRRTKLAVHDEHNQSGVGDDRFGLDGTRVDQTHERPRRTTRVPAIRS